MKRSLFIAIVVLLMAALFVSCNADKAVEDQLFEVTIDGGSRAVEASATLDVDIEQLFWFYKAEKIGGAFIQGQQLTQTAVKKDTANAPLKGLANSSLGQMSKGVWKFSFYGYNAVTEAGAPVGEPVYLQEGLEKMVNANITLEVTLTRGNGALPDPQIGFAADGITWMYEGVATDLALSLEITDNGADFLSAIQGTYDTTKAKYVFALTGTETIAVGEHTFVATVINAYNYNNELISEVVGQSTITIDAQAGMKYIIGDVSNTASGIDVVDVPVDVVIGTPTKPLEATTTIAASTAAITKTVNVSPAGAAANATTVTFEAESFTGNEGELELGVVTYSAEVASAKFSIATDDAVVAGIDLTVAQGTTEITQFNDKYVTVTTFIGKNLENVKVLYNGSEFIDQTSGEKYFVSYAPSTGALVFKTNHFSEFVVVATGAARIGNKYYGTLNEAFDAVQDGETIVVVKDIDLTKTAVSKKNNVVLDMNGKTIANTNDIWSDYDWALVEVAGGSLTITGEGKMLAKENDCYAIDLYGGDCIIENGEFVGNIHSVYVHHGNLTVNGGKYSIQQVSPQYTGYDSYTFTLNLLDANGHNGTATITVTGGSFYKFNPADNKAENPQVNFVAEGYAVAADGDYWTVAPCEARIGGIGYQSLADAIAAAAANDEIVVMKDIVIAGNAGITIPVGKIIILDLNGYTVKNAVNENKSSQVFINRGSLTLKDSTDVNKDGTGKGVLKNGIEQGTQPGEWWSTPQYNYATNVITNSGTLIVESGKIEQTAAGSICYAVDNNSTSYDTTLIINGGLVADDYGTAIRLFCNSATKENNIIIHDGKVETTGSSAIWVQLPGSNASSMKKASVTIDGGVISAGTNAVYDYSYGDGWDNVVYNISGGTFLGIVSSQKPDYKFISGGTFPSSANVRWGYVYIEDGDVYVEDANGNKGEKYETPWDKKDYWEEAGYTFTFDSSYGDYAVKIEQSISDIIGDYLVAGCTIVDNNDGTSTVTAN